jgi:hypothetical protein
MQVKGLSSEKLLISEADTLHICGRQNNETGNGEVEVALTESETAAWDQEEYLGIWETQSVIRKSGLRSNKP